MSILTQILYDRRGDPLFVLFQQGQFTTPLAILTQSEADVLALSVNGEKARQQKKLFPAAHNGTVERTA